MKITLTVGELQAGKSTSVVTFVVTRKLVWKGHVLGAKDQFEAAPADLTGALIPAWLEHGWVHRLGDVPKGETTPAKKSAKAAGAQVFSLAETIAPEAVQLLPTLFIAPGPANPRRFFDLPALEELGLSIGAQGLIQPIVVRPVPRGAWSVEERSEGGKTTHWIFDTRRKLTMFPPQIMRLSFESAKEAIAALPQFEIVAGERRWRACRLKGIVGIRAIVREMDDVTAGEQRLVENGQREDISALEEAEAFAHMLSLPGYTMQKLVEKTGKSESTIRGKLKLLDLPEAVQTAVAQKVLAPATAEIIGRLNPEMQQKAAALILPDADEARAEALSFRDAKEVIDDLKAEEQEEKLARQAEEKARSDGFTVLRGEQAKGVISYSDQLAHNSGYVAARDVCPHDPARHTWAEVVEQSEQFMAENHLFVTRYAVIANSHREGFKAVAIFSRDQVNVLLKALNLWNAQGSQKSREQLEKEAAKERHGQQREAMMRDMDAVAGFARRERNPRNVLLAAVWAATQEHGNTDAAEFVGKRRAWISLDGDMGEACSVVRSLATDLEVDDLQALVVELAMAQLGDEESYFQDGRAEMRRLFDLEFGGTEEREEPQTSAVAI